MGSFLSNSGRTPHSANSTSSVMAIGAASLADIFEPFERGTKLGIYYAAPLIGTSLGPILGGLLTQAFSWRVMFWFLAADIIANLVFFVFFFRDTFRKERSLTYQRVLASRRSAASIVSVSDTAHDLGNKSEGEANVAAEEASPEPAGPNTSPKAEAEISLSLKDVNPFPPLLLILKRRNNIATLLASGMRKTSLQYDRTYLRFRVTLCFHDNPHVYVREASRKSI